MREVRVRKLANFLAHSLQRLQDPRPAYLGIAALIEMGENDRAREWIARALVVGSEEPGLKERHWSQPSSRN
jgi:hypothetical protein